VPLRISRPVHRAALRRGENRNPDAKVPRTLVRRFPLEQNQVSDCQRMASVIFDRAVDCITVKTTLRKSLPDRGKDGQNRAEPVEIWKARNFIHEHAGEELSLTRVARSVNINANYLSEKFKEVTGVNFVRYVARTRYEKARPLLHVVDLRVSEIAFAVGFQSLSQFNRVFKKFSGTSPTEYRAMAGRKRKRKRRERVGIS
jgi:AraC-like DNA-binding protein